MQMSGNGAKVSDKPPVEIAEPQESLDQFTAGGCGPISNCTELHLVGSIWMKAEVWECDSGSVEFTFHRFDEKLIIQEVLQDLANVLDM